MHVVIDAQVVCGYFKESVLEMEPQLTDAATFIFDRVDSEDRVYLDEDGQIEQEWRQPVDPEWFDPWFAGLLKNGHAVQIPVDTCHELRRRLGRLGFPTRGRESRDIWYVRTARAIVDLYENQVQQRRQPVAFIISEDLHFHNPREKGRAKGDQRTAILLSGNGPVARYLLRNERICVNCVATYREIAET